LTSCSFSTSSVPRRLREDVWEDKKGRTAGILLVLLFLLYLLYLLYLLFLLFPYLIISHLPLSDVCTPHHVDTWV
jgi:pilus assembly protein TadC